MHDPIQEWRYNTVRVRRGDDFTHDPHTVGGGEPWETLTDNTGGDGEPARVTPVVYQMTKTLNPVLILLSIGGNHDR